MWGQYIIQVFSLRNVLINLATKFSCTINTGTMVLSYVRYLRCAYRGVFIHFTAFIIYIENAGTNIYYTFHASP
eukprot:SAG11_NODE_26905_length_339_cov_1.020833_1_plen_73_part_01